MGSLHRVAILVAALAAVAPAALTAPASAKVVEHRATGFSVKAPADFSARFDRTTRTYTIASRGRGAALTYRLVRTRRPARVAGRILASRAGAEVVARHGGASAFRARFANGHVMRVRRARPGLLSVVRFDPARWDDAEPLLDRIRASLRGGLPARLPAPRRQPQPERVLAAPRNAGTTLARSDFEAGTFAGWYVQSLHERATIVGAGAFGSARAARFEVREGDVEPDTRSERSEISLSGPDFHEGDDIYVRDALRVPRGSSIAESWLIVNQLHESDWGGSPGIAVFLDEAGGRPAIEIGSGDGDREFLESTPIEYDRWHDLVYRVKLSRDPRVGFVEVWLDGRQLTLANGEPRMHGKTIQAASAYLKVGIYRGGSNDGTTIVEHDDITVATTFDAATGG